MLLTFIYSACAEVCALITAAMTVLQQRLAAEGRSDVFFLSVTIEPKVDTPAVLWTYAHRHGADLTSWVFLTGSPQAVEAVWQAFGLTVKRRARGGVDHSAWTFVIDRESIVHYRYLGGMLEVEPCEFACQWREPWTYGCSLGAGGCSRPLFSSICAWPPMYTPNPDSRERAVWWRWTRQMAR